MALPMMPAPTIAIWGLAFKPNTDDIREAPAIDVIEGLIDKGANIRAFDPEAVASMKLIFGERVTYVSNMYDVLDGADALAILTEWSVFRMPDFSEIEKRLKAKVIFDGRNVYDKRELHELGFYYDSIGRP